MSDPSMMKVWSPASLGTTSVFGDWEIIHEVTGSSPVNAEVPQLSLRQEIYHSLKYESESDEEEIHNTTRDHTLFPPKVEEGGLNRVNPVGRYRPEAWSEKVHRDLLRGGRDGDVTTVCSGSSATRRGVRRNGSTSSNSSTGSSRLITDQRPRGGRGDVVRGLVRSRSVREYSRRTLPDSDSELFYSSLDDRASNHRRSLRLSRQSTPFARDECLETSTGSKDSSITPSRSNPRRSESLRSESTPTCEKSVYRPRRSSYTNSRLEDTGISRYSTPTGTYDDELYSNRSLLEDAATHASRAAIWQDEQLPRRGGAGGGPLCSHCHAEVYDADSRASSESSPTSVYTDPLSDSGSLSSPTSLERKKKVAPAWPECEDIDDFKTQFFSLSFEDPDDEPRTGVQLPNAAVEAEKEGPGSNAVSSESVPTCTTQDTCTVHVEPTEIARKLILIGDSGVGKSGYIKRYVAREFNDDYLWTVGVDFALKVVKWSDSVNIKLQLWDIAGQERFTSMTRVYYKDAHACIIMFDLSQRSTFANAAKWKKDLDGKCTLADGTPVPCMLLANKCDLRHREVEQAEIEAFCKEQDFVGWTETSVKDGLMVDESMKFLLEDMMKRYASPDQMTDTIDDHGNIRLSDDDVNEDTTPKCACSLS